MKDHNPCLTSSVYIASICGLKTSRAMFRLSLKVGVRMLLSTLKALRVKQMSFGLSSPESLFSVASLAISAITSFLKPGSVKMTSRSAVFLPEQLRQLKTYRSLSPNLSLCPAPAQLLRPCNFLKSLRK